MTMELKIRFNNLAMANKLAELSDLQWAILVEGEGQQRVAGLEALVNKASQSPELLDTFKNWHKAARLTDGLRAHGFPGIDKRDVKALLDSKTIGQDRVSNAAMALRNGDQQGKAQFTHWLNELRAAKNKDNPASTPAPSQNSSNQRFNSVPPPPGVTTGQTRNTPANEAPSQNNNVRQMPQADRQGNQQGQQQQHRPAYDQSEPTGPHNAPVGHQNPGPRTTSAKDSDNAEREYDQHSCFGRDTAVTFECTPNRERTFNTINIKVAKAKGKSCKEGVDWKNGIVISLEPHEVDNVACVLRGDASSVRYAGHGHDNQKWFEITENSGEYAGAIRLTLAHSQDRRAVNIGPSDIGLVTAMFYRALQSQYKGVDPVLIPSLIKRSNDLYQKNVNRKNNAGGNQQRA